MSRSIQHLTTLSLLAALALALAGLEALLPAPLPIPGIRLGLANLVTLAVLRRYGFRDASLVLLARILLASLLFGQAVSFLYSLAGGFLALGAETAIDRFLRRKHLVLTGGTGGLVHNLGQLLAAICILRTTAVLVYLPYLAIAGILTGVFIALAAGFLLRFLPRAPGSSPASGPEKDAGKLP